jgi:hypothetical protein
MLAAGRRLGWVVAAVCVVVAPGCGRFARAGTKPAPKTEPQEIVRVGEGVDLDLDTGTQSPAATSAPPDQVASPVSTTSPGNPVYAPGQGAFQVQVNGTDGKPRAGIPAKVTGPVEKTLTTDSAGMLRLLGPGGTYAVRIEPSCTNDLQIQTSATARIDVPVHQLASGTLSVAWRHRFAPSGPTKFVREDTDAEDDGRSWKLNTPHLVTFTVVDRCSDKPVSGAKYATFGFTSAPGVVLGPPASKVSDAKGKGVVRMTCTEAVDDIELLSTDREATDDVTDLFEWSAVGGAAPSCVG